MTFERAPFGLAIRTLPRVEVRGPMERLPISLPRRILVLGPSGAGKSTLACVIGRRVGLPVVHLDALYWNPGWSPSETSQFRAKVANAAAADTWVMDGNYSSSLDLRLPRAEAVIWLDLPRRIYFPRAVWRTIRHYGRTRPDIGEGSPERLDWSFFRNWVWTYPSHSRAKHAEFMDRLPPGIRGIVLKSRAEVKKFVSQLPRSLAVDVPRCAE